jgi:hypothetical protein
MQGTSFPNNHPLVLALQSENERLQVALTTYRQKTLLQEQTIRELREQATAGTIVKSFYELQLHDIQQLQEHVRELMQRAESAAGRETELEKEIVVSVNDVRQLEEIRSQYNHLQAHLQELQARLYDMQLQQAAMQQQAVRVAELESQLAIAEEEIELLKLRQSSAD